MTCLATWTHTIIAHSHPHPCAHRNYHIQAPTEYERTEWITAISEAAARLKRKGKTERPESVVKGDQGDDPTAHAVGPVKITYFPLKRGRAERLRLLLADIGVEFVNVSVAPTDWPALKKSLLDAGLQGTLPLVEYPDGTRYTQTLAAIRHFARLHERCVVARLVWLHV